jgi:hypothetical protein
MHVFHTLLKFSPIQAISCCQQEYLNTYKGTEPTVRENKYWSDFDLSLSVKHWRIWKIFQQQNIEQNGFYYACNVLPLSKFTLHSSFSPIFRNTHVNVSLPTSQWKLLCVRARPQLHSSVRDEHQHKHKVDGLVVIADEGAAVSLAGEPCKLKRCPAKTRMVERRSAEPCMHGGGWRPGASRAWWSLEGCCLAVTLADTHGRDRSSALLARRAWSTSGTSVPGPRPVIRPICITILYHNLLLFIDIFHI